MTASAAPAFRQANVAETPLGRTGPVDEVASLVLFLVSAQVNQDQVSAAAQAELADGGVGIFKAQTTLILGSDGAFDLTVQSTYQGGSVELRDYGHYEVAGANVTFHSDRSTPRLSTGSISGNTLTAQSQFGGIPFEIELVK